MIRKKRRDIISFIYIIILFIFFIIILQPSRMILEWIKQNSNQILNYVIAFILFFGFVSFFYWRYMRKIKKTFPYKVYKYIEEFEPSQKYSEEIGYHAELQGWLKSRFPSAKTEIQTGSSRPDIVIGNVAIEVKGPTDDNDLNSLGTKCLKYSQHYKHMIMVLFEPNFSHRNYDELMKGMKKHFPDIKVIKK